ncbi:MAG: DsbA family protein [Alphaproteobacteria bacterium]
MRLVGFRRAALGLPLVLGPALAAPPALAADAFSAEQRKAIEAIVRDYLIKNPEVIIEVIEAAKEKLSSDAQAQRAKTLAERRQEIFEDPNAPVAGNPKGDVTLVEFFDYRCPYCKQVAPSIEALLGDDKQLRVVYKEFPVLGPDSVTAARAALAARKQGKYEALHQALMGMKGQINEAAILGAAKSVGIDVERLKRDMAAPEIDQMLKANHQLAAALDINGTPGFVIGDEVVPSAVGIDTLRQLIATARSEKAK